MSKGLDIKDRYKVVIIGSGPAGLTAAIYAGRANLEPLVFEGFQAVGQLTTTTDVENYPGFEDGIMGPDLMSKFRKQAERFGAKCVLRDVTKVDLSKRPFRVESDDIAVLADTVIISSGASAKFLGIEAEQRLLGYGVSACATCDGFFFQDKELVVVGGGDTAMEEATFLTKFASKVNVVHRRDSLRASKIMQEKAFKNEKIEFIWNTVLEDIKGDREGGVKAAVLKNVKTGEVWDKECDGVFIAIGHNPNTGLFKDQLEVDEVGYIKTKGGTTETSVKGVFAAGDVQDSRYRQAVTAAGTGCMAAIDAERFLEVEGSGE